MENADNNKVLTKKIAAKKPKNNYKKITFVEYNFNYSKSYLYLLHYYLCKRK